jgi:MFS-type transporter involved in bile tolerance (Atg22 family)
MALVKSITGSYALGFILIAAVAAICLVVLARVDRDTVKPAHKLGLRSSGTAMTPG